MGSQKNLVLASLIACPNKPGKKNGQGKAGKS